MQPGDRKVVNRKQRDEEKGLIRWGSLMTLILCPKTEWSIAVSDNYLSNYFSVLHLVFPTE